MTWSRSAVLSILVAGVACSPPRPGKPTELVASEVNDMSVTLAWMDDANGETRFSVERSEQSELTGLNEVGVVMNNATSFRDESVQARTTYWYRVTALFADGSRTTSNTVRVTTQSPPTIPIAPTMFAARAFSENDIELTWTDNSANETGFELERASAQAGPFTRVTTTAADVVKHVDTGLTKTTTYWYRVRSVNPAGGSSYALPASATTYVTNDQTPPSTPTGVTATAISPSSITISWTASTDDLSGVASYRLLRNLNEVAVIAAPTVSHTVTLLGAGTMYCYQVEALDLVGNKSPASTPEACATTPTSQTGPNPPFNLTATTVSFRQINVRFSDNATDEQGFELERSTTAAVGFVRVALLGPLTDGGTLYADDAGLAPSTAYYYRARAFNDAGFSPYSLEDSAATLPTPPAAPSNLTATVTGSNTIRVAWTDNAVNEAGVAVEQSTQPDAGFLAITQTGANVVQFTPSTLSPSTVYYFRVRAFNAGGSSATVGPVTGTTLSAPNAPTQADAGSVAQTAMTITWNDNSANELGFRVERATAANGNYSQLLKPDGGLPGAAIDETTYRAIGLTANTQYFFRVRSVGDAGFSNPTQCTAKTLP